MVHLRHRAALMTIAFSLFMTNAVAREVHTKIPWWELEASIGDRVVSLVLPDGVLLEGTITRVSDDTMILQVRDSSQPIYRRGQQVSVPRTAIKVVQTRETKGPWRVLVAAMGAVGGAIGGWALAEGVFHTSGEGHGIWREPEGVLCLLGAGAGGAAAGYAVGRKVDRDIVYFDIVD
jgi:hypothetical protein